MLPIHKTYEVRVLEKRKNGGRIIINTGSPDRQRDRVFPTGGRLENYQKNPVVQWGHNYRDPFATIGRTNSMTVSPDGMIADFDLRPAANDSDPQNIVLLLWNGEWIKTASIGFIPYTNKGNEIGGNDFTDWELLEWSLVPIPANAEALRLAMKSLDDLPSNETDQPVAREEMTINPAGDPTETPEAVEAPEAAPAMRAWIRKVTIETDAVRQHYANFMTRIVDVPEAATILIQDDTLDECREEPHPDRGKTVVMKMVLFVPPLSLANGRRVYTIERRDQPDEELIQHEQWRVNDFSDVIDYLPDESAKSIASFNLASPPLPIDIITDKVFDRAVAITKRLNRHKPTLTLFGVKRSIDALLDPSAPIEESQKAGRVLSRKNEKKIESARDTLNEVLNEVAQQPETDAQGEEAAIRACPHCGAVLAIDEPGEYHCEECRGAFDVIGADLQTVVKLDAAEVHSTLIECPNRCGATIEAFSWGMYSCPACRGTFEVVPADEDLKAHPFPELAEAIAVEFGDFVKGAIAPHTTPKADPDTAWDAGAVLRAAPNDRRVLRRIHAWVNGDGDPDAKQSYKLPHHMVDGRVVLRGVNNAKARLPQSSIPQSDHAGVERHLNRHQAQFKEAEALRDFARALTEAADSLDGGAEHLSDEDERVLVGELRTLLNTVQEMIK